MKKYDKDWTPGEVRDFKNRTGGYINFKYNSSNPERSEASFMHTEEEVNQMLEDFDSLIEKYFPWMKDFVIFQLKDGTIRLDVADRQFLSGE